MQIKSLILNKYTSLPVGVLFPSLFTTTILAPYVVYSIGWGEKYSDILMLVSFFSTVLIFVLLPLMMIVTMKLVISGTHLGGIGYYKTIYYVAIHTMRHIYILYLATTYIVWCILYWPYHSQ